MIRTNVAGAPIHGEAGRPYLGLGGPTLVVRRKNHPRSAFRAEDALADNAIGHNAIIGSRQPLHRRAHLRRKRVYKMSAAFPQFKRNVSLDGMRTGGSHDDGSSLRHQAEGREPACTANR